MELRSEITRIRGLREMPERSIQHGHRRLADEGPKERTTGSNKDGRQGRKETDTRRAEAETTQCEVVV